MHAAKWKYQAATWFIPVIALAIAGRQVYLASNYDLSIWKGGGMGMFAGMDSAFNRYARVFIINPGGERLPVTQLPPSVTNLIGRALYYPVRSSFLASAREIAALDWVNTSQRVTIAHVNARGENFGHPEELHSLIVPYGVRAADVAWKADVEIQYWKISYDPVALRARTTLAQTFVFKPQELQSEK